MKKVLTSVLAGTLVITVGMAGTSCTDTSANVPATKTTTPEPTQVPFQTSVEDLIKGSSTFKFDGVDGSIKFKNIIGSTSGTSPIPVKDWEFTVEYQTRHPGHGDRSGQMLAQQITTHTAIIKIVEGKMISAICDDSFDIVKNSDIIRASSMVSGIVIGGGDTTAPGGPLDTPRVFVYEVKKDDGTMVNVSYTAYPPSPVGDAMKDKIVLKFRGGSIQAGDLIQTQGTYDKATNTIVVGNQGGYIVTWLTEENAQQIAADFIKNSATFKFDGIEGSIKYVKTEPGWTSSFRSTAFIFDYQTGHPGHGDRTGKALLQVITNHTAIVLVHMEKGAIMMSVCDKEWDMVNDKNPPMSVYGTIVSGGDTTQPGGPLDAPRTFVYQVKRNDETMVNVSYTAYPPSPAGDAARAKITLEFNGGTINIGDRIEAYGRIDKETNTVVVADQGDFIRTYPKEP